jgi:hypothetical protein
MQLSMPLTTAGSLTGVPMSDRDGAGVIPRFEFSPVVISAASSHVCAKQSWPPPLTWD